MLPVKHSFATKECTFCRRERPLVCFPKLRRRYGPCCSWCASKIKEGAKRRTTQDKIELSAAAKKGWRTRKRMVEARHAILSP